MGGHFASPGAAMGSRAFAGRGYASTYSGGYGRRYGRYGYGGYGVGLGLGLAGVGLGWGYPGYAYDYDSGYPAYPYYSSNYPYNSYYNPYWLPPWGFPGVGASD
jgi:hypothetical protein